MHFPSHSMCSGKEKKSRRVFVISVICMSTCMHSFKHADLRHTAKQIERLDYHHGGCFNHTNVSSHTAWLLKKADLLGLHQVVLFWRQGTVFLQLACPALLSVVRSWPTTDPSPSTQDYLQQCNALPLRRQAKSAIDTWWVRANA